MPDTVQPRRVIVPAAAAPVADPYADQLRAVAEAMLDPLVVLVAVRDDGGAIVDFSVTFVNSAFATMNGVDRATIDGQRMLSLLPAYRENGLFAAFAAVTETGDPYLEDAFSFDGVDPDGRPYRYAIDLRAVRVGDGVAATGRDITTYLATHEATVTSEERFRLLAERSPDVIFKYRTSPVREFEYVSPSIETLSGYKAAELYADPTLAFRMIHPDDRPEFDRQAADGNLFAAPIVVRWVRKDGRIVWTEQTNTEILDGTGQRVAVEGVARDATIRVEAAAAVAASESRFRSALEGIGLHAAIMDRTGRILFVNSYLARRTGWSREELVGRDAFEVFLTDGARDAQRSAYLRAIELEQASEDWETEWLAKDGTAVRIAWTSSLVRDESGAVVGISSVGEDVTERRQQEARQARLSAAVEQTAEAIIVTSADGRIVYANPAFEAASGVRSDEAVGRRPWNVLQIGHQDGALRPIIRQLRSGHPWAGEWEIRRADGGTSREEVSVAPMRDPDGAISGYVAVARDVTQIREMQQTLDGSMRQREAIARALSRMETRPTADETAQEVTDAIAELPGVDIALLVAFDGELGASIVAATALHAQTLAPGANLPEARAADLRERAAQGPWAEPWIGRPEDGDYGLGLTAAGVQAMAYAPVLHGGTVVGILSIGTASAGSAHRFEEQLPTAIEFAATARNLLAAQLTERRDTRSVRSEISAVLAAGTFRAVFQPIVDMSTTAAIGYEALTRFDDGTPPDRRFAAARRAGSGIDLEEATLERAVTDSMLLPAGPWLALNVTAEMVLDGSRLSGVLRKRTRPVVLEITEHDPIDDYQAVRAAVAALGPDVRIAVDDAGAGVANFTHIVQLRPDFVKVDASLVHGVNSDLTRQALIVGLHHFARATNGWVIAEGVETEEERMALRAMDVNFGQGYHFGRPAPAEAWERPRPEPAQRPASVV